MYESYHGRPTLEIERVSSRRQSMLFSLLRYPTRPRSLKALIRVKPLRLIGATKAFWGPLHTIKEGRSTMRAGVAALDCYGGSTCAEHHEKMDKEG